MTKPLNKPLTPLGYRRLAEEHRQLLEDVRPGVVEGIATAAAEGDRSENAEYIYGKKRLREIDRKLRSLTYLIKDAQIIDPQNIRSDQVEFGATVEILDEHGKSSCWTIVGEGEADVDEKTISWKSPLACALWDKRRGDIVLLERPAGEIEYEIVSISFGQSRS